MPLCTCVRLRLSAVCFLFCSGLSVFLFGCDSLALLIQCIAQFYPDVLANPGFTWTTQPALDDVFDRIDYIYVRERSHAADADGAASGAGAGGHVHCSARVVDARRVEPVVISPDGGSAGFFSDHRGVFARVEISWPAGAAAGAPHINADVAVGAASELFMGRVGGEGGDAVGQLHVHASDLEDSTPSRMHMHARARARAHTRRALRKRRRRHEGGGSRAVGSARTHSRAWDRDHEDADADADVTDLDIMINSPSDLLDDDLD